MNRIFSGFLLLYFSLIFSQNKVTVYESENQKPVKGAKISCDKKLLGETDEFGIMSFSSKCMKVSVEAKGFVSEEATVDKTMEVYLDKIGKTTEIQGVIISDKSDPRALAILDKVFRSFKDNSPNSLDSYSYKSYEKMSYDVDKDSIREFSKFISRRKDSLESLPNRDLTQKEKAKKDSLEGERLLSMMGKSKLFLWERALEYLYSKEYGEKVNILDNRIAGFKNPIYEMLTLRSNRNRIPREILPENRNLYRYYLTDTLEIDSRKNFVIRFRQIDFRATSKRKYNGYIYIDAATYGIKKIESNSKVKNDGSIASVWIPINNKWFLLSENLKVKMGSTLFEVDEKKKDETKEEKEQRLADRKRFGSYVYMKADYFDYKTPVDLKESQFRGYTMTIENADGSLLDKYRTDSLTQREKLTYTKLDSLGNRYKLDQYADVLRGLVRGRISVGKVDVNLFVTSYNRYEGLRLGAGFKANEKFSRYISPDFYYAYGLKDKASKYGVGLDIHTSTEKVSFFRLEYFNDVAASGRFSQNLWNAKMKFMNAGMLIENDKYYKYDGFRFGYQTDISNPLTVDISAGRQNEEAGFIYRFMNRVERFQNFSTLATIKFSPNSKNIMTPNGRFTYEQNFPELYFNYEQGYKALGDFNYSRFDALFTHQFHSRVGATGTRFYGGYFLGKAPVWHQFEMGGLDSSNEKSVFSHFNLTTYLGFATMTSGRYFNDKFVGYYFTHRLPWYFKSFGKNTSSFDLVYKGIIGNMSHPEYHQFDFQKLNHLYQEAGLEYNNFLSTRFNLGLFYRVGYYATSSFKDNFAIQLKLKILGF